MSEYQPVLEVLREKRRGKPGELMLTLGILTMIAAPFGLVLATQSIDNLAALKTEGMVAEATVTDKAVRAESYVDSNGRARIRDSHKLSLRHDLNAQLSYADWKAGKPFPAPQFPALTTREITVAQAAHAALAKDQTTTVIHNPQDYSSMMLTEAFEQQTSGSTMLLWYLGAAAAFVAGAAMTVIGWRQRTARG